MDLTDPLVWLAVFAGCCVGQVLYWAIRWAFEYLTDSVTNRWWK